MLFGDDFDLDCEGLELYERILLESMLFVQNSYFNQCLAVHNSFEIRFYV